MVKSLIAVLEPVENFNDLVCFPAVEDSERLVLVVTCEFLVVQCCLSGYTHHQRPLQDDNIVVNIASHHLVAASRIVADTNLLC